MLKGLDKIYDQSSAAQFGLLTYYHSDASSNSAANSFHFDSSETSSGSATVGNSGYYVGTNEVYHAGNDGAGSGLDADLFDGLNSTQFWNGTGYTDDLFWICKIEGCQDHISSGMVEHGWVKLELKIILG